MRVRSVSRGEVWASAGVQGAWVGGCGCEADKGHQAHALRVMDLKCGLLRPRCPMRPRAAYPRKSQKCHCASPRGPGKSRCTPDAPPPLDNLVTPTPTLAIRAHNSSEFSARIGPSGLHFGFGFKTQVPYCLSSPVQYPHIHKAHRRFEDPGSRGLILFQSLISRSAAVRCRTAAPSSRSTRPVASARRGGTSQSPPQ